MILGMIDGEFEVTRASKSYIIIYEVVGSGARFGARMYDHVSICRRKAELEESVETRQTNKAGHTAPASRTIERHCKNRSQFRNLTGRQMDGQTDGWKDRQTD